MSDQSQQVHCEEHGVSYATFVCQHLARGKSQGFYSAADGSDPCPDAWCYQCDRLLLEHRAWNEEIEAQAGIKVICAACYNDVRTRNDVARPSIEFDGWCLGSRSDVLEITPDFEFPALEAIKTVNREALVKLLFLVLGNSGDEQFIQGERMWVRVTEKTAAGFVGTLESHPQTDGNLQAGQFVDFTFDHVLAIDI